MQEPMQDSIAGSSARIQRSLVQHGRSRSQSSRVVHRRMLESRSPMTGIKDKSCDLSVNQTPHQQPTGFSSLERFAMKSMHPHVIESWILSILSESEHPSVPVQVSRNGGRASLEDFKLDRTSLMLSGIKSDDVDKLYKSLFVYSAGFSDALSEILKHTEDNYFVVSQFWKLFLILLENVCAVDYEMAITQVDLDTKAVVSKIEKEYEANFKQSKNENQHLKQQIDTLMKAYAELETDRIQEQQKREVLESELSTRDSGHEDEVGMRLKFESQLNHLYAVSQDYKGKLAAAEEKYELIKLDLQEQKSNTKDKVEEIKALQTEISQFSNREEEANVRIKNQIRKIQGVDFKSKQDDVKIETLQTDIAVHRLNETHATQESTALTLKLESANAALQQSEIEVINTRKSILKKKKTIKKLEKKIDEQHKEINQERNSYQTHKQQVAMVEEERNSLQEQLQKLNEFCTDLESQNLKLQQINDAQKFNREEYEAEIIDLREQLSKIVGNVDMATKGRQEAEDSKLGDKGMIENLRTEMQDTRQELREMKDLKEKYEMKYKNKASDLESLEKRNQYNAHSKATEIEMLDRKIKHNIDQLNKEREKGKERLAACNEEKIQRGFIEAQVSSLEQEIADLKRNKTELYDSLEKVKEQRDVENETIIKLQKTKVGQQIEISDLQLVKNTLESKLKFTIDNYENFLADKTKKFKSKIEAMENYVSRMEMKEQDQYSRAAQLTQIRKELNQTVTKLKNQILGLNEKVRKLETERGQALVDKDLAKQAAEGLSLALSENKRELTRSNIQRKQTKSDLKQKTVHVEEMTTKLSKIFTEIPKQFSKSQNPIREMKQKLEDTDLELQKYQSILKLDAETSVEDLITTDSIGTQTDVSGSAAPSVRGYHSRNPTPDGMRRSLSPDVDASPMDKLSQRYYHEDSEFPKIMRMDGRYQRPVTRSTTTPAQVVMDSSIIDETPEPMFVQMGKNQFMEQVQSASEMQDKRNSAWKALQAAGMNSSHDSANKLGWRAMMQKAGQSYDRPKSGWRHFKNISNRSAVQSRCSSSMAQRSDLRQESISVPRPATTTGLHKPQTHRTLVSSTPNPGHQRTSSMPLEPSTTQLEPTITENQEGSTSNGSSRRQISLAKRKSTPQKGKPGNIATYLKQANSRLKDNFEFL